VKNFIKKHYLTIILTVAGAVAGLLYWKFVGCLTGSCPVKSRWYLMTLYGAIVGYLAGSLAVDFRKWISNRKEIKSRMGQKQ